MCFRPLQIRANKCYDISLYTPDAYTVPCGKCEECRNLHRSDWATRMQFEVHDLSRRGGHALMLLLSYNDKNLPLFPYSGLEDMPCFNKQHVLDFLNKLKVYAHRLYGKGSFKYMICSEYGEHTRRPHYHIIIMLEPCVDWLSFCLKVHEYWKYGFVFPKYDKNRKIFVDNHNKPVSPLVQNPVAGGRYCTKYVTKDLYFMGQPRLAEFLKGEYYQSLKCNHLYDEKRVYDYCLPFHLQSKSLGACILNYIDYSSNGTIAATLNKGVLDFANPGKYLALPRYIVNKLLYKNVNTKDTEIPRISSVTGKYLYDRDLSEFGKKYLKCCFKDRVVRQSNKIQNFYDNFTSFSLYLPCLGIDVSTCKAILQMSKICIPNLFEKLGIYHTVARDMSCFALAYFGTSADSKIYNLDFISDYYVRTKDTSYLRKKYNNFTHHHPFISHTVKGFGSLEYLDFVYKIVSRYLRKNRLDELIYQERKNDYVKRLYASSYDKNFV